jgi:hypothetical protein
VRLRTRLVSFGRVPKERPNATRLLKHPWLADARPRTLATPLTNISMENGPLGFRAPSLVIPSSASPARVITQPLMVFIAVAQIEVGI